MVKNVSGYAPRIPSLQTCSRVPSLDVRAEGVRVLGYRGGKTGGDYRRGGRSRSIETAQGEVVLTLGERQLRGIKIREHLTPGDARVVLDILEIPTRPAFGRGEGCKRVEPTDDYQSLITTSSVREAGTYPV